MGLGLRIPGRSTMSSTLADTQQAADELHTRIRNNPKNSLENLQLATLRLKDGIKLTVALQKLDPIDILNFSDKLSTIQEAYPIILATGEIDTKAPLILKTIHHSDRVISSQPTTIQPAVIEAIDSSAEQEAANNTLTGLCTKTCLIEQSQNSDGTIVAQRALLMSKAQGISVATATHTGELEELTPAESLLLVINIIDYVEKKLHQQNIIHHDASGKNILINPKTLQVTVIDIDPSHFSPLTQAPEERNLASLGSIEADIYSLTQDVFMTILSGGIRPWKEGDKVMGIDMVEEHITQKFSLKNSGTSVSPSVVIINLLRKMHSQDPKDRGSLSEAKQILIAQLQVITGKKLSARTLDLQQAKARQAHERQLQTLDRVLSDPKYNQFAPSELPNSTKKSSFYLFRFFTQIVSASRKDDYPRKTLSF